MSQQSPEKEWIRLCDYKARCWVNGMKDLKQRDGSRKRGPGVCTFDDRFLEHPWVRQSIAEGWDRELRGHIVRLARLHVMGGGQVHTLNVVDLMPDASWVKYAREQADRARLAAEWREEIEAKHRSVDAFLSKAQFRSTTFKQPKPPSHIVGAQP
jgi:hypothetical protein